MNFLNAKFAEAYGAHTLGVRSEHLEIKESGGAWPGTVVHTEHLGSDSYAFVEIGSAEAVIVRQGGHAMWQPGQAVQVSPIGNQVHRFDKAGKPIRH
jgi:multiple sugar transport system ATP-binding protein